MFREHGLESRQRRFETFQEPDIAHSLTEQRVTYWWWAAIKQKGRWFTIPTSCHEQA